MNKETDKIALNGADAERIRTKLKFVRSERNGALISFVSQNPVNGCVCGVRQDSPYPKKIVIIDRALANEILVNILYDCELVPMSKTINERTGEEHVPGYIAVKAQPHQFKASIEIEYRKCCRYVVRVKFGNKTITFNPFKGRKETLKSYPACRAVLEKRCDVKDLLQVLEDFDVAVGSILDLMHNDLGRRK